MDEPTIRSGMPFNLDDLIRRRAMLLVFLLYLSPLPGCSQPESPHFVPATAGTSRATPADREGTSKPVREAEPPIKIEMH